MKEKAESGKFEKAEQLAMSKKGAHGFKHEKMKGAKMAGHKGSAKKK